MSRPKRSLTCSQFQSTLSVRRATISDQGCPTGRRISIHALRKESDRVRALRRRCQAISIHALRKESDRTVPAVKPTGVYFNPRSP